jgi:hypothetical protein
LTVRNGLAAGNPSSCFCADQAIGRIRHRQRGWHVLGSQACVLQHRRNRARPALDPERHVSDQHGGLCVYRLGGRGKEDCRGEDHAQADWAELDAVDDRCERFPPRSIVPESVAKAIRHRQRGWHVLWFQAGVLQHSRNRRWLVKHRRRLGRDQMFQLSCRNAPSARHLLCRFRHQRARHIVAISPPCFRGVSWREATASLIEELADQRAARANDHSVSLRRSGTELVPHAVPCLAIENCLVLPGVAGALMRDLADVDRIR